jgi:hypothetical protein
MFPFPTGWNRFWGATRLLFNGHPARGGVFLWGLSSRELRLTTHLNLPPSLRTPPLPHMSSLLAHRQFYLQHIRETTHISGWSTLPPLFKLPNTNGCNKGPKFIYSTTDSSLSEDHCICNALLGNIFIFLFHGSTTPVDLGRLVVEGSRSHSDTSHSVGLLWAID